MIMIIFVNNINNILRLNAVHLKINDKLNPYSRWELILSADFGMSELT